ncbi:Alpha/Beta hydrolase protein [Dactylonectria macrodidyma]|uniref:Alpha/Beta hydrolase protein n=1 Tax=Dactylonectria macrodidyma TaxID=307937 RepID=A0A9P9D6C0_9HYPO|nr:Alpha/Beta hydrolase protein [Dactylonectria macrodidyma]
MALPLSKTERLGLALRLVCLTPLLVLIGVLRSTFTALVHGLPFPVYLICAFLNLMMRNLEAREIQYLCQPTMKTYKNWISRKRVQERSVDPLASRLSYDVESLDDGQSSLLWVGDRRKAQKIVLFFHGGGYIAPLLLGHLEWCWRAFVMTGIEMHTEVAVAVLDYTLSPEARYPVQLCQAASALSHLLASGFQPQDIIIGGDSAGGGLAAQLLCHLAQPYPKAVPIQLTKPLAATFLVSPWLTRCTTDRSFAENSTIDMLSAVLVDKFATDLFEYDNVTERDPCLEFPLDLATPFGEFDAVTKQMFVTAGKYEVFREQCVVFVDRVRCLNPKMELRFDIQEKMAHDFILLEGLAGQTGECVQEMKGWMEGLLAESLE